MKPEHAFVAERMLAQHSASLFAREPEPVDLLPHLTRMGEALVRRLATGLAPLCGGDAPEITMSAPRLGVQGDLPARIAPLAANSLFACDGSAAPLFCSIEAHAVLRLVDRTFGGRGTVPSPLPAAFPLSAELMIARLETLVCTALVGALGDGPQPALTPFARNGQLHALPPFAADMTLSVIEFAMVERCGASWTLTLAVPHVALPRLFGAAATNAASAVSARGDAPNPAEFPFADVPLTVRAELVDMRIAVAALSALQVGQILPVAVARSIPISVGEQIIAHGTIGALDDRVAVQLTHAF